MFNEFPLLAQMKSTDAIGFRTGRRISLAMRLWMRERQHARMSICNRELLR
jgi:hypothetical protein